jgi:hypothetical protein
MELFDDENDALIHLAKSLKNSVYEITNPPVAPKPRPPSPPAPSSPVKGSAPGQKLKGRAGQQQDEDSGEDEEGRVPKLRLPRKLQHLGQGGDEDGAEGQNGPARGPPPPPIQLPQGEAQEGE